MPAQGTAGEWLHDSDDVVVEQGECARLLTRTYRYGEHQTTGIGRTYGRCDGALAQRSGRYWNGDREQAPAKHALVVADQDRLWKISEELIAAALRR